MSDKLESAIEATFGFIWRWFWRIVIWGTVAVVALFALLIIIGWANEHPERWGMAFLTMFAALSAGLLFDVRRLLQRLVEQNDAAARARRPDHF